MRRLPIAFRAFVALTPCGIAYAQGTGGAPTVPHRERTPAPPQASAGTPAAPLVAPAPASSGTGKPQATPPPASTGTAPSDASGTTTKGPTGENPSAGAAASDTPASPPIGPDPETAPGGPPELSPGPPRPRHVVRQPEPEPAMPPARDTVGGHVGIGASAGYGVPLGSVGGASHRGLFAPGLALSADAAYGVSRTVMVGLYGALGTSDGRGPWSGGDVSSFGVGPFVRYHLVQGTRFDPWMSFGIGFRQTTVDGTSQKGIDWARIQLGGDWYAFSRLGIGPVLELAFRSFIDPPFGTADSSVNAHFVLGGRIVFDAPGK